MRSIKCLLISVIIHILIKNICGFAGQKCLPNVEMFAFEFNNCQTASVLVALPVISV